MKFEPPLAPARLLRRYKRFLADVVTADGRSLTLHCPNTGAMTGCADPGAEVWYSTSANPKRKYPHSLELVTTAAGDLVGVNTGLANTLVAEAVTAGLIPVPGGGAGMRREVPVPDEAGRFDFCFQHQGHNTYAEVKSLTWLVADGLGLFPDAVSARATRHVQALTRRAQAGDGALLIFCVQHAGVRRVAPASALDPAYAQALAAALQAGVQVQAWGVQLTPQAICVQTQLPFQLGSR